MNSAIGGPSGQVGTPGASSIPCTLPLGPDVRPTIRSSSLRSSVPARTTTNPGRALFVLKMRVKHTGRRADVRCLPSGEFNSNTPGSPVTSKWFFTGNELQGERAAAPGLAVAAVTGVGGGERIGGHPVADPAAAASRLLWLRSFRLSCCLWWGMGRRGTRQIKRPASLKDASAGALAPGARIVVVRFQHGSARVQRSQDHPGEHHAPRPLYYPRPFRSSREPAVSGRDDLRHAARLGLTVEESQQIIDRFIELGGNFIDTANFYTKSHSEKIIGDHVGRHPRRRDRLVIATKFSGNLYPGDPNGGGSGRKSIIAACENSLRRLQTDYIDLYWLHNWDVHTPIDETMAALEDLVRTGKVRYLGVSDTPAWKIAEANVTARFRGWSAFIGLQIEYSLLERTVGAGTGAHGARAGPRHYALVAAEERHPQRQVHAEERRPGQGRSRRIRGCLSLGAGLHSHRCAGAHRKAHDTRWRALPWPGSRDNPASARSSSARDALRSSRTM